MRKLRLAEAQRLLIALREVDQDTDTKLPEEVRLDVAININRLMPVVGAFEKVLQTLQQRMMSRITNPQVMNSVRVDMEAGRLGERVEEFDLKVIDKEKLKLSENPKIRGDMLSRLAPIINKFDDDGRAAAETQARSLEEALMGMLSTTDAEPPPQARPAANGRAAAKAS
jgi:hypothetical protein